MTKSTRRADTFLHQLTLILTLLLAPTVVAAMEPISAVEPDLDTVSSGTLYLKNTSGYLDAPLLNSTVSISISGVVSKIELTQSFQNNSTDWVEGLYVFPLPNKAAVNSMIIQIGDREIMGSIHEKKQAEKQYKLAKKAGHVAGIVKQHRPNLFSTRIANIPPGESISIVLGYIQTVRYENDRYSLRVPLTITPRYTNTLVNDADDITPPQIKLLSNHNDNRFRHSVAISTQLFGQFSESQIGSPSHALSISPLSDGANIELADPAHLDRDFILEWHEAVDNEPAVQAWRQTVAGEEYLLATVMPPRDDAVIPEQARELILVIDTSGSMAGVSIDAARSALLDALQGLRQQDRFNIIEFNSDYRALFRTPQSATESNRAKAERFTNRLHAEGGTEMMGALRTALGYSDNGLVRQVVFITDGSVGYEKSVIKSVKQNLGSSRLFTIGIGDAPNLWFIRKVAEVGRGSHQIISDLSQVHTEMSRLLVKLQSPALTDISVSFDSGSVEVVPNPIPDLYANEPVVIAAKLSGDPQSFSVSGQWGEQKWSKSIDIDTAPVTDAGLSTVWARQKIESLEDKQRFHSDPNYYRSLILRTALDHQLLSRHTAFLAVDTAPVREVNESLTQKKIPNLMPVGSAMQPISFPQGAAGIDTLFLLGLCASLMALIAFYFGTFVKPRQLS